MISDFFSISITLKSLCLIVISLIAIFALIILIIIAKKKKEIRQLNCQIDGLENNRHIFPGEAKKGRVYVSLEDKIFQREDDEAPIATVDDWISSNFPKLHVSEVSLPARAFSTSGRICVEGPCSLVWVELSNPQEEYTVRIKKQK